VALRTENDLLPIGRIAPLGIITRSVCQPAQPRAVKVRLEDVHIRVEVPFIAPMHAGLPIFFPLREFLRLMLLRLGIQVAGGEYHFLSGWMKICASGFADAGADAPVLAAGQIHTKDLVEWIVALLFGLKDDLFAVGRKVALAGADEVESDLLDIAKVV